MGLKLTVPKTDNALYTDFVDAYWRIENIIFSNADGVSYVDFELNTYPSRDAANKNLESIANSTFNIGGPRSIAYQTCIRTWQAQFKTANVFTDGIPVSESGQKDVLYTLVKQYTKLPFEDVLEQPTTDLGLSLSG